MKKRATSASLVFTSKPATFSRILYKDYKGLWVPPLGPWSSPFPLSSIKEEEEEIPQDMKPAPMSLDDVSLVPRWNKYSVLEPIKPKDPVQFEDTIPPAIAKRIADGTKTPPPTEESGLPQLVPAPPSVKPPSYKTGRPRHRAAALALTEETNLPQLVPSPPPMKPPRYTTGRPRHRATAAAALEKAQESLDGSFPSNGEFPSTVPSSLQAQDAIVPPAILKRIDNGTRTPPPTDAETDILYAISVPKTTSKKARARTAAPHKAARRIPPSECQAALDEPSPSSMTRKGKSESGNIGKRSSQKSKIPVPSSHVSQIPQSLDETIPPAVLKRINNGTKTPSPPPTDSVTSVAKKSETGKPKSKIPLPNRPGTGRPKKTNGKKTASSPSKKDPTLSSMESTAPEEPILFKEKITPQLNWVQVQEPSGPSTAQFHDDMIPPAILKRMQEGNQTLPPTEHPEHAPPVHPTINPLNRQMMMKIKLKKILQEGDEYDEAEEERNIGQELIWNHWFGDIREVDEMSIDCNNNFAPRGTDELPCLVAHKGKTDNPNFWHNEHLPEHPDYEATWFDPVKEFLRHPYL